MSHDDWNKSDDFVLYLSSPVNPFDRGFEGLEEILAVIESLDDGLRPDLVSLKRRVKYSRQTVRQRLREAFVVNGYALRFVRSHPPQTNVLLSSWAGTEHAGFSVELRISPLSFLRTPERSEEYVEHLVDFVRALAARLPISYGRGHSQTDFFLSSDPLAASVLAAPRVQEAFWLNVYGPPMLEQVGRQRALSAPATLIEQLPGGAILLLTRPTPTDFDSEEARLAQGRTLVHLRPELDLEFTLATLRQRSLVFTPIPIQFDPDVADILSWEVELRGLANKRQNVELFNRYCPPPISEWLPASQAPEPDVEDVKAAIDSFASVYAEQLIALFHKEEPVVMDGTVEALPRMDFRLWHFQWAKNLSPEQRETLVTALGGWLGRYLVDLLGGRWVPRRRLEETAVIIGDRAWLPFLRARHALQNVDAPLDYSCSQLFREAQRLAGQKPP
ncbi:DUF3396 domain-containing protein [Hyalangium versicolor]|uniref:DUF3396 domain-containing protein n=1 Tax=Hyalangium versicolor TaxID=2861190 RepID=UPI001CCEFC64|nr:DUF3396 domain-containing protein [Hyalangium versicolor]